MIELQNEWGPFPKYKMQNLKQFHCSISFCKIPPASTTLTNSLYFDLLVQRMVPNFDWKAKVPGRFRFHLVFCHISIGGHLGHLRSLHNAGRLHVPSARQDTVLHSVRDLHVLHDWILITLRPRVVLNHHGTLWAAGDHRLLEKLLQTL